MSQARVDRQGPLDQPCLAPQCGFSSTVHGNAIACKLQAAQLRLVVVAVH